VKDKSIITSMMKVVTYNYEAYHTIHIASKHGLAQLWYPSRLLHR